MLYGRRMIFCRKQILTNSYSYDIMAVIDISRGGITMFFTLLAALDEHERVKMADIYEKYHRLCYYIQP